MDKALLERRKAVVEEHFESEVSQEFDRTIETFNHPHYEIMATGQVFDGEESVMKYYLNSRKSFPDQRHENVRLHFAEDLVISEFDLLGTNTGPIAGLEPTGLSFRVPMIALFFFEGDLITNERIYFDSASLFKQIGQESLLDRPAKIV